MKIKLLFFLFIIGYLPILVAQPNIRFEKLKSGMLLDIATVNSVIQDRDGFLWFATESGFFKYDGHHYFHLEHDPLTDLSPNYNGGTCILEDHQGNVWMGSLGGGLLKLEAKSGIIHQYYFKEKDLNGIPSNKIIRLCQDSKQRIWIGSQDRGLLLYNASDDSFESFVHDPHDDNSISHNDIGFIFEDSKDRLWIATRGGGLNQFDEKNGNFIRYKKEPRNENSISSNEVTVIYEKDQKLWIGTWGGGLNVFDVEKGVFKSFKNNNEVNNSIPADEIWSLSSDKKGNILIGTSGSGLALFDIQKERFFTYKPEAGNPFSLDAIVVRTIFKDREGIIWLGTFREGVFKTKIEVERFSLFLKSKQLKNKEVLSITEYPQNILWLGTAAGGLFKYDLKTKKIDHIKFVEGNDSWISPNTIYDFHGGKDGKLWCGTAAGLYEVDPISGDFDFYYATGNDGYLENTYEIVEDEKNQLWMSRRRGGVYKFDKTRKEFERFTVPDSSIQYIIDNVVDRILIHNEKKGFLIKNLVSKQKV